MGLRTNNLINNFSSGELSPELLGRVDLAKYQNGAETMVNWLPMIEGGMVRRPGTRFVAPAKFAATRAILVKFVFSILQAYMLEFGVGYIRFFKDGGQIIDEVSGDPIELGSPYQESDLPRLKFRQDADTLYIAHPGYQTRKLTRSSHTNWTLDTVSFQEGPFLDQNSDETHLVTATGGQLIINGVFDVDTTGWTDESAGTGTLSWAAGQAVLTNGGGGGDVGAIQTSFPTVPGLFYTVTFDVATNSVRAKFGSTPGGTDLQPLQVVVPNPGATLSFTALTTTSWIYFQSAVLGSASRLDNVSCIQSLHTGASVTLTSTADLFEPGHVGSLFKLTDADGASSHPAWIAAASYSVLGFRVTSNGRVYQLSAGGGFPGNSGIRPPVHLRGVVSDGNLRWTFLNDGSGYVEITGFNHARSVSAIVRQHLPANAVTGTSYWAEGVFSGKQGYPRALAFVEQRFALAGATNQPSRVDLSETGNYEGFKQGTLADQAIGFVVASGEVNTILWMEKGVVWFVGTNGVVYALTTSNDTPITPDNLPNVKELFNYGSADIQPLKIGGNLLYVQRGGTRVREINYEAGVTNDIRSDRTILARHLTAKTASSPARPITAWSYEGEPNSTVWAIRSDGTLLALTYFPEQDVIAWSRHVTDGMFESVATIPTATGDQTWVLVQRTINGVTTRYIEYLDDTLNTDCALTYSGSPISTLSADAVAHVLGKEVQIIASGGKLTPVTIGEDDLTFTRGHAHIELGLKYDSDCLTVRPELKTNQGSLQGVLARNPKITARVVRTPTLRINNKEYPTRGTRDYMDTGPPFVTGDIEVGTLGHTTTKQIRIQQVEPFPAKVIGLFVTTDAGEI